MPSRPNVITKNANGAPANPSADIVSACVVIAPAYQGTLQTKQYSRRKQVYDQYLEGPLVRAAVHCIETASLPVFTQRCEATNDGTYATIDVTGFNGSSTPAVLTGSVPRGEYELYFVCITGGTVGTPGITYRLSTAGGRGIDSKDIQRLGTATSVTFGDTGCGFEFGVGDINAGAVVQCQTFGPTPSSNELAASFATISEGDKLCGLVLLPWRVTPSYGPTISEGLDLLRDNGLPCRCIVQARRFDVDTDIDLETYRDNLEDEWSEVVDDRIVVVATDMLFILADGSSTLSVPEKRLTGGAISFAARAIATPLGRTTWAPSDGPIEGGSLVDSDGVLIGWNEPLGVQTRLQVFYRVPNAVSGRPTVPSKDFCLTDPTSSIKSLRVGRILDQVDRIVRSFAWNEVGLTAEVTISPDNTAQGVLSEDSRQDLIRRCAAKLESDPVLQSSVTNLSDSDLVTLESNVTVEGDVVFLEFGTNINPRLGIGKITFTHNVRTEGN